MDLMIAQRVYKNTLKQMRATGRNRESACYNAARKAVIERLKNEKMNGKPLINKEEMK